MAGCEVFQGQGRHTRMKRGLSTRPSAAALLLIQSRLQAQLRRNSMKCPFSFCRWENLRVSAKFGNLDATSASLGGTVLSSWPVTMSCNGRYLCSEAWLHVRRGWHSGMRASSIAAYYRMLILCDLLSGERYAGGCPKSECILWYGSKCIFSFGVLGH